MTDDDKPKNKGGRPRKHPVGARVPTLAFRVRAGLRDRLENSAKQNDRSISEEIERRLDQSYLETNLLHSLIGDGEGHDFLHAVHQSYVRVQHVCGVRKIELAPELFAAIDTIARVYFRPPSEWLEDYGRTGNKPEIRPGLIGQEAAYQWLWWSGDPRLDAGKPAPAQSLSEIMAGVSDGRDRNAAAPPRPSDSGRNEGDELPLDAPAAKPKRARKTPPKA